MRANNLLFKTFTLCTLGLAGIASQAFVQDPVSAETQLRGESRDLMQRVMDLEDRQEQADVDFHLVDQSLHDLDFRIDAASARSIANKRSIHEMQKRLKDAMRVIEMQKAEYRALVESRADGRLVTAEK